MAKILITGTAGFIGFHLVNKLLKETDWQIVGLDNINDYYDVNLKYARLKETGIEKEKIQYNSINQFIPWNPKDIPTGSSNPFYLNQPICFSSKSTAETQRENIN